MPFPPRRVVVGIGVSDDGVGGVAGEKRSGIDAHVRVVHGVVAFVVEACGEPDLERVAEHDGGVDVVVVADGPRGIRHRAGKRFAILIGPEVDRIAEDVDGGVAIDGAVDHVGCPRRHVLVGR